MHDGWLEQNTNFSIHSSSARRIARANVDWLFTQGAHDPNSTSAQVSNLDFAGLGFLTFVMLCFMKNHQIVKKERTRQTSDWEQKRQDSFERVIVREKGLRREIIEIVWVGWSSCNSPCCYIAVLWIYIEKLSNYIKFVCRVVWFFYYYISIFI